MLRIDDSSAAAALPAPEVLGTEGYFTEGSPGVTPATLVRASWLNMVQEELRAVVVAGGLTPSKTTYNQVMTAIKSMIDAQAGNYCLDTGAANAYVVALDPPVSAYVNGMTVRFRAVNANTGASTVNAGAGVVALKNDVGGALISGDLPAGFVVTATYDSTATAFLINSLVPSQALTPATAAATYAPIANPTFTTKATSPSFVPNGSTIPTNGMYLPATNTIAFAANGVEQWRCSNGVFQFGTTARTEPFSVYKPGGVQGDLVMNVSGAVVSCMVTGATGNAAQCALNVAAHSVNNRSINMGGTLQSSGADYAEYKHKDGDFNLVKGAIVGINKDGKLTPNWSEAIHFMVKSTKPSIVGGDDWGDALGARPVEPAPPDDHDSDAVKKYKTATLPAYQAAVGKFDADHETIRATVDRIAFAGQVPVNVKGAKPGDYIVPVQDGKGIKGIAVSKPTFEQYMAAVGKVESIETDGRARIIVKAA